MSDTQLRGPLWGGQGTAAPFTGTYSGAQRVSDAHGRFTDAVLSGRTFYLSASAATATAYVGAAAGTPLIAVHNPVGSNKTVVGMMVSWAARVGASAAGNGGIVAWAGPSVAPTGTRTNPTNARSQAASGSAVLGFVNAALTGSTALALALPLIEYQMIGATPVSQAIAPCMCDVGGLLVADPGNQIAIGLSAALTSLTNDIAFYWEEIPYQPAM